MSMDVIFFELRGRRCALPVAAVREVLPVPGITPVPLAPATVRGIAPVHGHAVPVIDLGVWFSATSEPRLEPLPFRTGVDKVLLVESAVTGETTPVQAALVVDRVMRLGTVEEQHSRAAPAGPAFINATVLDLDEPALLVDLQKALDQVRDSIEAMVQT
jgi:purine-binding chemotaxis protein CheW